MLSLYYTRYLCCYYVIDFIGDFTVLFTLLLILQCYSFYLCFYRIIHFICIFSVLFTILLFHYCNITIKFVENLICGFYGSIHITYDATIVFTFLRILLHSEYCMKFPWEIQFTKV